MSKPAQSKRAEQLGAATQKKRELRKELICELKESAGGALAYVSAGNETSLPSLVTQAMEYVKRKRWANKKGIEYVASALDQCSAADLEQYRLARGEVAVIYLNAGKAKSGLMWYAKRSCPKRTLDCTRKRFYDACLNLEDVRSSREAGSSKMWKASLRRAARNPRGSTVLAGDELEQTARDLRVKQQQEARDNELDEKLTRYEQHGMYEGSGFDLDVLCGTATPTQQQEWGQHVDWDGDKEGNNMLGLLLTKRVWALQGYTQHNAGHHAQAAATLSMPRKKQRVDALPPRAPLRRIVPELLRN